jgi:sarcosine oxidase subunit beta
VSGLFSFKPFWRERDLQSSYDVVIIGGGAHGLATAYELTKLGVKNIAVLEMNYIGAGGSGRNTTILRANYKTPEGIAFYGESLKIYRQLSQELDFNLLISTHGHLTLAHSERSVAVQRERAEANQLMGVDSRWVEPGEVAQLCPQLNMSRDVAYPIQGALYHPPGAVIRHDAVVWGYARKADAGSRSRTAAAAASRRTAGRSPRALSCRPSPAGRRGSRTWPASRCRSRTTRCRRS